MQLLAAAATSASNAANGATPCTSHSSRVARSPGGWIARKFHEEQAQLLSITGDPGDVMRDENAYGQSTLTFKDVSFSVRMKKVEQVILEPVSGHFDPGTLVALMGPSGSGKTTLLDILAGKKTSPFGGTVLFNGRERERLFRRMVAYVPQQDYMFPHATVIEAVRFSERLKQERPTNVTRKNTDQVTEMLLSTLGLTAVKDVCIGNEYVRGISGGQQRRLSLARGLATGAQIIFCDEPTSGLSATDADACVRYMRLVAHKLGVTIIVVIHQPRPEVARLFDHLILLTSSPGRAVYNGSMAGAMDHWRVMGYPVPSFVNPTDWYLDLITPGAPGADEGAFVTFYNTHCKPQVQALVEASLARLGKAPLQLLEEKRAALLVFGDLPAVRDSIYGVRFRKQVYLILRRQLRLSMRDPQGIFVVLLAAVGKAVVVGMAYWDIADNRAMSQLGFIFMVLMTSSLDGMAAMPKLIEERKIVKMEVSEGMYSEWAHIIVFTVITFTVGVVANALFVTILFAMSGLNWAMFPYIFGWTTALFFTMDGLYGMVASFARDSTSAQVLALPVLTLFLLYNGFTVNNNTAPSIMKWALQISPVANCIEAIAIQAADLLEDRAGWLEEINLFGYQIVFFKTMNGVQK